jgi:hypothetical protein
MASPILSAETKALKQQALALYLSGYPMPKIALNLGLPFQTVKRWSYRGKWSSNREQAIEKVKGRMSANIALRASNSLSEETRTDLAEVLSSQAKVLRKNPAKRAGQLAGRDGLATAAKTVVDAAATIFGWSESRVIGLVDVRQLSVEHDDSPILDVSTADSISDANSPENVTETGQSEAPKLLNDTEQAT